MVCGIAHPGIRSPWASQKGKKAKRVAKAIKQRLLREGVKLLGRDEVAYRLRISLARLNLWLRGRAAMPDGKMPRLADRMLAKLAKK